MALILDRAHQLTWEEFRGELSQSDFNAAAAIRGASATQLCWVLDDESIPTALRELSAVVLGDMFKKLVSVETAKREGDRLALALHERNEAWGLELPAMDKNDSSRALGRLLGALGREDFRPETKSVICTALLDAAKANPDLAPMIANAAGILAEQEKSPDVKKTLRETECVVRYGEGNEWRAYLGSNEPLKAARFKAPAPRGTVAREKRKTTTG